MKEIIEKGYLYMASPPLYKIKKGKSERYIHDDEQLEDFLLDQGLENVSIEGVKSHRYKEIFSNLIKFDKIKSKFIKRGFSPELIRALSVRMDLELSKFSEKEYVESILKELQEMNVLDGYQAEIAYNTEFERYILVLKKDMDVLKINTDFVTSPEFKELRRLAFFVRELGSYPFKIKVEDETFEFESVKDLVSFIEAKGKKGIYLQRYKGLGEMNPSQLWETTVDPKTRTLYRVTIDDAEEADNIFTLLMGDVVAPRREFIEANALNVTNLDI
jgi:DNA gyrase subunit B